MSERARGVVDGWRGVVDSTLAPLRRGGPGADVLSG